MHGLLIKYYNVCIVVLQGNCLGEGPFEASPWTKSQFSTQPLAWPPILREARRRVSITPSLTLFTNTVGCLSIFAVSNTHVCKWGRGRKASAIYIRILVGRALLCLHINYTQLGVALAVKTNTHKLAATKTSDTNCTLASASPALMACRLHRVVGHRDKPVNINENVGPCILIIRFGDSKREILVYVSCSMISSRPTTSKKSILQSYFLS